MPVLTRPRTRSQLARGARRRRTRTSSACCGISPTATPTTSRRRSAAIRSRASCSTTSTATASSSPARWRCCCGWAGSRPGSRPASRPGRYDGVHHQWLVSDIDAHAWVEAWFPRYGWVRFDPTPAADPAARRNPGGATSRLRADSAAARRPARPGRAAPRRRPARSAPVAQRRRRDSLLDPRRAPRRWRCWPDRLRAFLRRPPSDRRCSPSSSGRWRAPGGRSAGGHPGRARAPLP